MALFVCKALKRSQHGLRQHRCSPGLAIASLLRFVEAMVVNSPSEFTAILSAPIALAIASKSPGCRDSDECSSGDGSA